MKVMSKKCGSPKASKFGHRCAMNLVIGGYIESYKGYIKVLVRITCININWELVQANESFLATILCINSIAI